MGVLAFRGRTSSRERKETCSWREKKGRCRAEQWERASRSLAGEVAAEEGSKPLQPDTAWAPKKRTGSWGDHRSPASALSLKGPETEEVLEHGSEGSACQRPVPHLGDPSPAVWAGRVVRCGGTTAAQPTWSAPAELEVFWRLWATHTHRLHSSRDSGPHSGCSRSCSKLAGGGGGGGGRGLQTRAIAPALAHFPFGSSRRHRLPVSRASIGPPPVTSHQGALELVGGGALKGPWLRRGLGPAYRLRRPRPQEGCRVPAAHLSGGGIFHQEKEYLLLAKHSAAWPAWKVQKPPDPQLWSGLTQSRGSAFLTHLLFVKNLGVLQINDPVEHTHSFHKYLLRAYYLSGAALALGTQQWTK